MLLGAAMYKEGYPAENGDILSKMVTTPILGHLILNTLLKAPFGKGMSNAMVNLHLHRKIPPRDIWKKLML